MNKDILSVIQSISNQKSLSQEKIFHALESALSIAIQNLCRYKINIYIKINIKNGDFNIFRRWIIVTHIIKPIQELTLNESKYEYPFLKLGNCIEDQISSTLFENMTTQTTRYIIFKKIKEVEQFSIINNFFDKKGQLVTVLVKKIKQEKIILNLGNSTEAVIIKPDMLPIECCRKGDFIKGILYSIYPIPDGMKIFFTRSNCSMLMELFNTEISEVKEGFIEVQSISRDPGLRSKIAVKVQEDYLDPVGSCVGLRGSKIKFLSKMLNGERIDIILWDKNPMKFIMNSITPADVILIIIHKNIYSMDITVDSENLSQTLGKNGQNIRLASQLTGWSLNIITVNNTNDHDSNKIYYIYNTFINFFNFNQYIIDSLIQENYSSLEDLMNISYSNLLNIKKMNHTIADFLKITSYNILSNIFHKKKEYCKIIQQNKQILSFDSMNQRLIFQLFKKNIFTLKSLSYKNINDLNDIKDLNFITAGELIISSRKII